MPDQILGIHLLICHIHHPIFLDQFVLVIDLFCCCCCCCCALIFCKAADLFNGAEELEDMVKYVKEKIGNGACTVSVSCSVPPVGLFGFSVIVVGSALPPLHFD